MPRTACEDFAVSTGRELMRVSDADRQAAAERLRAAMGEGRLDLLEYDTRLAAAYAAVTYADLEQLFTDLPAHGAPVAAAPPAVTSRPAPPVRTGFAGLPIALKVLWTIWFGAVLINLTVWLLVSLGNGPEYFWPMWMAVPGVALTGVTAAVTAARSHR
jgi:Domain of unknown function (DUF1707)